MTELSMAARMVDKLPEWLKKKDDKMSQMILDIGGIFLVHPDHPPLVWDVEAVAWRETK